MLRFTARRYWPHHAQDQADLETSHFLSKPGEPVLCIPEPNRSSSYWMQAADLGDSFTLPAWKMGVPKNNVRSVGKAPVAPPKPAPANDPLPYRTNVSGPGRKVRRSCHLFRSHPFQGWETRKCSEFVVFEGEDALGPAFFVINPVPKVDCRTYCTASKRLMTYGGFFEAHKTFTYQSKPSDRYLDGTLAWGTRRRAS